MANNITAAPYTEHFFFSLVAFNLLRQTRNIRNLIELIRKVAMNTANLN